MSKIVSVVLLAVVASSCAKSTDPQIPSVLTGSQSPYNDEWSRTADSTDPAAAPVIPSGVSLPSDPGRITHEDPPAPDGAVTVSPDKLRELLLTQSTSILAALNRLHTAKDQVNIARASLFPSINLSTLLLAAASPVFAVAEIDFLLPFLLPSKWFDLAKQKDMLRAEKMSFLLVELNQYASAYSLILTLRSDIDMQRFAQEEADDLDHIAKILRTSYEAGAVPETDALLAESQAAVSRIRLKKLNELIVGEHASLRKALALPLETPLVIPSVEVPASSWETSAIQPAVDFAKAHAPERLQLQYLNDAAKADKWSKIFSFITGFSLGAKASPDGSLGFSNMLGGGGFNLGFAQFPMIQLANRNVDDIRIRGQELDLELNRVLETALSQVSDMKTSYDLAVRAEENSRKLYHAKLVQYEMGMDTLRTVLLARGDVREAATQRMKAAMDLNLMRITLHRMMLTDQFAQVPGCEKVNENMSRPELKEFEKTRDQKSLEQLCRG